MSIVRFVEADVQVEEPCLVCQKAEQGKMGSRKVMELNDYISSKKNGYRGNKDHWELEEMLWIANCFIIPLIVYPIVSLVGHLIIELSRDHYAEAYGKVGEYLRGKKMLNHDETAELDGHDLKVIKQIFKDNVSKDEERLQQDYFYQQLMNNQDAVFVY